MIQINEIKVEIDEGDKNDIVLYNNSNSKKELKHIFLNEYILSKIFNEKLLSNNKYFKSKYLKMVIVFSDIYLIIFKKIPNNLWKLWTQYIILL